MGVQGKSTIKSWFETGDYPTQEQFWDWIDSFLHVNESTLPSEKVSYTKTGITNAKQALDALYTSIGTLAQSITDGDAASITTIKGGVADVGNTLKKVYDLIVAIKGGDETNTIKTLQDQINALILGERYKGRHVSLAALTIAYPGPYTNAEAVIDAGVGIDSMGALWDVNDSKWVISGGGAVVADNSIIEGSLNPVTGNAIFVALSNKVDKITGKGLSTNDYTALEQTKLAGIAANATNYSHPATHPASVIEQNITNRLTTDAEKAAWNAKRDANAIDITIHFKSDLTYTITYAVPFKITIRSLEAGLTVTIKTEANIDYVDNTPVAAFGKLYITGSVIGKSINLKGVIV